MGELIRLMSRLKEVAPMREEYLGGEEYSGEGLILGMGDQ
jgi:hypothetical protein